MKRRHGIGMAIIGIFIIVTMFSFKNSLTPYVTFAQAKSMSGSVQIRGVLAAEQVVMMDDGRAVKFKLLDEDGQEVVIVYKGTKPNNMEQAANIVAIGKYHNDQFIAEKLLVKCPSKYQPTQGSVK